MFDYIQQHNHPSEIKIIEKKAPTDDSIRLYDELLEKTKSQILGQIKVEDNIVNGSVIFFKAQLENFDLVEYAAKFKLNGIEHIVNGSFKRIDTLWGTDKEQKAIQLLYENLAKHIAAKILQDNTLTLKNCISNLNL